MRSANDLTGQARIRDAALRLFAAKGPAEVSMQAIASEAGVSPALVVHHFGSKDGLRRACDDHVVAMAREGSGDHADAATRDTVGLAAMIDEAGPARTYLARALLDGTPAAAELFDEIVEGTEVWLAQGEEEGWVRPTSESRTRAAVYVSWLLAPMAFGAHVSRAMGTDITTTDATLHYSRIGLDLLTHGLFTDDRWLRAWDEVRARRAAESPSPPTRSHDEGPAAHARHPRRRPALPRLGPRFGGGRA